MSRSITESRVSIIGETPKKQEFLRRGVKRLQGIFLTVFFNPLALWALPLYSLTETQGERVIPDLLLLLPMFSNPSVLRTPPLYFALQNAGEEGDSNPPLIAVRYPAYGARQGGV